MASAASKPTKNQLRRAKKKADRAKVFDHSIRLTIVADTVQSNTDPTTEPENNAISQPPPTGNSETPKSKDIQNGATDLESVVVDEDNELFDLYKNVMGRFEEADKQDPDLKEPEKPEVYFDDDDEIPDEEEENAAPKISKKKRKEMNQLSVAELKALVQRPEMVEWTDTSAPEPKLLVHIKSHKNVVPVPNHWSLKREYLSSKRGIEKPRSRYRNLFKRLVSLRCEMLLSRSKIRLR